MRRMKIKLGDLILAREMSDGESSHYLDTETGSLLLVTYDNRRAMETISATLPEEWTMEEFEEAVEQTELNDYEKESVICAAHVDAAVDDRYIEVEPEERQQAFADMEEFIGGIEDDDLQDQLDEAIRGRGAFRRFKDILLEYPHLRDEWFRFRNEQQQERAMEWLRAEGIELEA